MQVTVKFKILPTKEQEQYLKETLNEYISTVNNIVQSMINNRHIKLTSKDIEANLPSAEKIKLYKMLKVFIKNIKRPRNYQY